MDTKQTLENLINQFNSDNLNSLLRAKSRTFRRIDESLLHLNDDQFNNCTLFGEFKVGDEDLMVVITSKVNKPLSERTGKKAQYTFGKKFLKESQRYIGGFFIFYDDKGDFRFSLIYDIPLSTGKRDWSNFRRYTYFVSSSKANKTFRLQFEKADFSDFDKILKAFSLDAVTDEFYNSFKPNFDLISASVKGTSNEELKKDFALLFIIRVIFLGFVQKKLWLNKDEDFILNFWKEYKTKYFGKNLFYNEWVRPLFFESLNNPPGRKVFNRTTPFSENTALALQMAPYLNGELFKEKKGYDDCDLFIPDINIEQFFDFLFSYNFTIEENTLYDQDLELNPEFLGIIFERLVNKEDGAVYTPRTEVDFMCRISLVKWLEKNSNVAKKKLYHLFFDKQNENSKEEILNEDEKVHILSLLKNVTVCDPAAGSGAFPVGMLQVLDEVIHSLTANDETNIFERKKEIISRSLYGVEVKHWAVWINQLRLWLSLFIDMPDEFKSSFEPLLPNLEFKIRRGDSLVQIIGNKLFTVESHANISPELKRKITELKKEKSDFFFGKSRLNADLIRKKEADIFKAIIEEQILDKKKTLKVFGKEEANEDIFGSISQKEELRLHLDEKKQNEIKEQIKNLEEELRSIKDEHPLVWNIEFAEIFFDRNGLASQSLSDGGFDIIIGNPPYVRQEKISDPNGKFETTEYKELLRQTIYEEFPEHFYLKKDKSKLKIKIDGKSDLYTFFYLKSLKLLNEKGVHTFICSNSWLDVGYGKWLQEFILENVKLDFVIDNNAKRSFSSADVNTIITVIEATNQKVNENHKAKFIVYKRPFDEVLNTENLLLVEYAETITKDDDFRVYPITYKELKEAGTVYEDEQAKKLGQGIYEGDKWGGKYLRAPDIFFTILEKGKDKLVRLGDIAKIKSGIITGDNNFYYRFKETDYDKKKFEVAFKSPKDVTTIMINGKDTKYVILKENRFLHKRARILTGDTKNDKFIFHLNSDNILFEHKFIGIDNYKDEVKLIYILNSTLIAFISEVFGNSNLGEGALYLVPRDIKIFIIPNPDYIDIKYNFIKSFLTRRIKSIFEELGFDKTKPIRSQNPNPLPDRKALDDIIFDALGLTQAEREEVYYAVAELVQNRLNKAKSV
ncbi:Type II restriction enzyme methylase subunit [Ignavibacterium album JCM 16511]|uniref:site-specific DNA-methyltransferase (adenine-specific) n=1 Tax=Ignavibacterium album (strain DSM 19864 / JCM 16511 / NBRC 101810 / Mat9-16) TaxID=945713 RepID=I0AKY1_IGNAJ|nr:Eco57I restriction-modification methylase domain-containing protein [Ignavibacterium album]AFH49638.1 Type II restriction enzyme methylase subunit [Ignavibacterium album JCM 16511]